MHKRYHIPLPVEFREADAEALPFPDASFDLALSTFAVMFTPDHARSASEMMRVVRVGGRIGMANWTPEGFIGQLFKTIGKHVPPQAGLKSSHYTQLSFAISPFLVAS